MKPRLLICNFLLVIAICFANHSYAQDLEGVWKGFLSTSQKEIKYEVVIKKTAQGLVGYSNTIFDVNGEKIHALKKVNIDVSGKKINFLDDSLLLDNFKDEEVKKIVQRAELEFRSKDVIVGKFRSFGSRNLKKGEGLISLQRLSKPDTAQMEIKEHLASLGKTDVLKLFEKTYDVEEVIPTSLAKNETVKPVVKTATKTENSEIGLSSKPKIVVEEKQIEIEELWLSKPKRDFVYALKKRVPIQRNDFALQHRAFPRYKFSPVGIIQKSEPKKNDVAVNEKPKPQPKTVIAEQPKTVAQTPKPEVKNILAQTVDLSKRKIEMIDRLLVESDSLILTLYDNGEVDGDTVSLILNGKMLLEKQMLSTNAVKKTIYMTPELGDSINLVMYADNLGRIPPNTGLLIIQDGNKRHEIRFSGDLSKNAGITLYRRKE